MFKWAQIRASIDVTFSCFTNTYGCTINFSPPSLLFLRSERWFSFLFGISIPTKSRVLCIANRRLPLFRISRVVCCCCCCSFSVSMLNHSKKTCIFDSFGSWGRLFRRSYPPAATLTISVRTSSVFIRIFRTLFLTFPVIFFAEISKVPETHILM